MHIYVELLEELERGKIEIDQLSITRINKVSEKIKLCQDIANKLRDMYLTCDLTTIPSQIRFFKEVKPKIMSELHYYMELLTYLKEKPKGSLKGKKHHIDTALDKASFFITKHCEFNQYMQLACTHLDEIYFTKRPYDPELHGTFEYPADISFSSPADPTLSCLLAANRYADFLKNEHFTLKHPNLDPTWEGMKTLTWQKSKTDLVELMYGFYASGAMNGDLKDLFEVAEKLFKTDLGNFYRTYSDIKFRKDPTQFLTEMRDALKDKINSELND